MVLVYGSVCWDRLRRVPRWPAPGEYVEWGDEFEGVGGEAANTAVALARWGCDVVLFGNPVGNSPEGDRLREALAREGLAVGPWAEGEFRTPVTELYVTPDGQRTMFGKGFANMDRTVDPRKAPLQKGEWFTAEPNHGKAARDAVRMAHRAGMKLYLMDFFQPDDPVFEGSWWQSGTDWVGRPNDSAFNSEWLSDWAVLYGCHAILTDGPREVLYSNPDGEVATFPVTPEPNLVDTTGAGDVFRAATLWAFEQGFPPETAIPLAIRAASLNCRALGAVAGVPSWNEVLGSDLVDGARIPGGE